MSRNLLLKSGRLYAWHSSDAKSYVDISTPGIVTKTKEGGAGFATNAYLWPANDTSPNVAHCCTSLFDLANAFDCFTLSVDIKVSSSATPADVTNVTVGGGYSLMTIKARASVEIENPSIGGRNLLKQTATKLLPSEFAKGGNSYYMEDGFCVSKVTEKWVGYEAKLSKHTPGYPFAVGDTITVSADVRGVGYTNIWAIGSREIGNTIFYPATGDTHFPISSTWERVSATFVMTQANVDWLETEGNYIRMGFENDHDAVDGSYYEFRKMKLEKGTKATDWTPAPEDVDSAISDLEDKTILNATALEQRLSSQILQTQEQIQQSVSEQYFTKDETNTLISQVSTAFTQTAEGWQMDFNKIVSIVNANQAATDSEFQEWSKYIRFVDGNIILGAVANPVVLTIKNDRISFSQSGQEVAYLSNAELVITDARVTHSLIIGKFGFIPRANGSLDFKKVL